MAAWCTEDILFTMMTGLGLCNFFILFQHLRALALLSALQVRAASQNGTGEYDYDLFTIGAGSGGVRATRFSSSNYGVLDCSLSFHGLFEAFSGADLKC